MNVIDLIEKEQINELASGKSIESFNSGDTVKVNVRIRDGATERIQAYEGVVIAKKNAGINTAFVVRKISHGETVERKFLIYSPSVASIEVIRRGVVRRAKLYYLRKRVGKAARIQEDLRFRSSKKK